LAGAIAGLVAFCMIDRLPFGVRRLRAIAPLADLSIEMRRLLLTRSRRSATVFVPTVIGTLLNILSIDLTGHAWVLIFRSPDG
jgi:hypothetical protein